MREWKYGFMGVWEYGSVGVGCHSYITTHHLNHNTSLISNLRKLSTVKRQPKNNLQPKKDYDAIVVGSGPNGLAAAITLQQAGISVLLIEGNSTVGGGLRSEALTLPGFTHDLCSAVHPLAVLSPFFQSLPLSEHGLHFLYPEIPLAHPFDDGTAMILRSSLEDTASAMGADASAYLRLMKPLVESWPAIRDEVLSPLHFPSHPLDMARFGWKALSSASRLSARFQTEKAKGFWGGLAMHAQIPFNKMSSSAIGLVLLTAGHIRGWPVAAGGSQSIANALLSYFKSIGGKVELNLRVKSLDQLPSSRAVLLDITPAQLLEITGNRLSSLYRWQLNRFRLGMGVFKIDWALAGRIPFPDASVRNAGTVHLGGTFEEIMAAEQQAWTGSHASRPGVILAQQSIADPGRAPEGQHTGWAYCHVPLGSTKDMTKAIEDQVERFAPGFRERILARHTMNTAAMESYNPNYAGGDISGGANILSQLFTRPALRASPYRSSCRGIYLCSASTPPGGGVHGMCGYHAAKTALKDIFAV